VARPHGIGGELRLKVYNLDSDLLLHVSHVRLRLADGSQRTLAVNGARAVPKGVLVKLAGIDDRGGAESLRGAVVLVERAHLPPPEEGEFYACDLEGARVELAGGEPVGTVRTVASYPTCDVLVIDRPGSATIEVPLIDAFVADIDVAAHVVRLSTLEGVA
jgi:16S rRNA processing protein RimM